MPQQDEKRPITIVSAVMRQDGFPDFVVTQVEVTQAECDVGIHLYLAEADLLEAGFEEPSFISPKAKRRRFCCRPCKSISTSLPPTPSCTPPVKSATQLAPLRHSHLQAGSSN